MTFPETYPCNAGMKLPQGFHKFIFSNGVALCELCGFFKEDEPRLAYDTQHFKRGVEIGRSEREREIITALEGAMVSHSWGIEGHEMTFNEDVFELIKGETK